MKYFVNVENHSHYPSCVFRQHFTFRRCGWDQLHWIRTAARDFVSPGMDRCSRILTSARWRSSRNSLPYPDFRATFCMIIFLSGSISERIATADRQQEWSEISVRFSNRLRWTIQQTSKHITLKCIDFVWNLAEWGKSLIHSGRSSISEFNKRLVSSRATLSNRPERDLHIESEHCLRLLYSSLFLCSLIYSSAHARDTSNRISSSQAHWTCKTPSTCLQTTKLTDHEPYLRGWSRRHSFLQGYGK